MTPDEYCDTIRGIAFDRETTKAAFEAGRLDYARESEQELAIAYIDGHARGRESLRIELERLGPVAWYWTTHEEDHEPHYPDGLTVWGGTGPDADVEALGASRGRAVRRLYARPIPAPDVRELVEALESFPEDPNPYTYRMAHAKARAALAKFGGGV